MPALVKAALERVLQAESTNYLCYERLARGVAFRGLSLWDDPEEGRA